MLTCGGRIRLTAITSMVVMLLLLSLSLYIAGGLRYPLNAIYYIILLSTGVAGSYYIYNAYTTFKLGYTEACRICGGKPAISYRVQSVSCIRGNRIICYSNISRKLYIIDAADLEEHGEEPDLYCVKPLELPKHANGYHGVFLARGDKVYRVTGALHIFDIKELTSRGVEMEGLDSR